MPEKAELNGLPRSAIANRAREFTLSGAWRWKTVLAKANAQPALRFYAWDELAQTYFPFALNVLSLRHGTEALIEHIGLLLGDLVVEGLEVEPADVIAADVFATVGRTGIGDDLRLHAGSFDE